MGNDGEDLNGMERAIEWCSRSNMDPKELLAATRRRPFTPFRLTLTEGTTYDVRHPEFCMVGKRSAVIGLEPLHENEQLFDHTTTVDLLHIVKLEPLEATTPPPKSNGSDKLQ